jgi:2-polyprenyl-3-methyl-5-hydroxy-6-metoxy-1,4-benzoquinol methylase
MTAPAPDNSQGPQDLRDRIKSHFDSIAGDYDAYKQKASYYYSQLQELLIELLPEASSRTILEIGCGTGALLARVSPRKGLGIDISGKMIEIARHTWASRPELGFSTGEAETLTVGESWDAVIMADVLEHLYSAETALANLIKQLYPQTLLILTWANPIWSPILHLLEFLRLKMPEGPHKWQSIKSIRRLLEMNGMELESCGTRCLIPSRLPLANPINRSFHKIPGLASLGLISFITARKR